METDEAGVNGSEEPTAGEVLRRLVMRDEELTRELQNVRVMLRQLYDETGLSCDLLDGSWSGGSRWRKIRALNKFLPRRQMLNLDVR